MQADRVRLGQMSSSINEGIVGILSYEPSRYVKGCRKVMEEIDSSPANVVMARLTHSRTETRR